MATGFLIIIYMAFISLGLPDSLLGSAWPMIWPDMNTSFGTAGIITMVISGGTIISSLLSGRIIKKFGTGKVTLISCLLTAAPLMGFSIAPSILWIILLAIPLGLGAGSVDSALNHYVAENYKAHHMNWLHCFWGVGATTGPIIMSYYTTKHNSWREGYMAVSIIQFAFVIILFITLPLWKKVAQIHEREKMNQEPVDAIHMDNSMQPLNQTKQSIFKIKGVKFTLLAFLLYCGTEITVGLWGASYLVGARHISAERAAGWVSLYYGGITTGRLITGFITMKVSNRVLIRCGQFIALVGGFLLLLPLPVVCSLIGFVLIGLGLAPIYPGLIHETPKRFGSENSADLIGYQMAVAYTGSTFLPPLFGALAMNTSVAVLPIIILVYVVFMLASTERVNKLLSLNSVRR